MAFHALRYEAFGRPQDALQPKRNVIIESFPRIGQYDGAMPPMEELNAQSNFDLPDSLTDSGLRNVEFLRCFGKGLMPSCRFEGEYGGGRMNILPIIQHKHTLYHAQQFSIITSLH